ncbi:MAG: ORF6N domain-containing protein [Arcobacter sp.]|uniref:ORF6N domain-containing protein n=1 Tax=Arcobacter sp. TaxID=1872629 RepID=UPI003AFF7071
MQNFPSVQIQSKIYHIRNKQVMIDSDLAVMYEVQTKRLKEQVNRNIERFPDDFMFQLTSEEFEILRSQNATSSWGGRRYMPYVFTEQGVYMLATVLKGDIARDVTILIMRTFTKMREFSLSYENVIKEITNIKEDNKLHKEITDENTKDIRLALKYLQQILEDTKETEEKVMGFRV